MTAVDWIILVLVLGLAAYGYGQGFIVGALSLGGFAAGAFLGTRLAPLLLEEGSRSPYAPLFGLLGALLAGGLLASAFEVLGAGLRGRLTRRSASTADAVLGAGLTGVVGLLLAWLVGAVALQTPGARELRREIQASAVLQRLNDVLPPTGPILNALARFDPFPQITGPGAGGIEPPSRGVPRDPEVRAAGRSVVRIVGTACGLGVTGSGWAAGDGLVVTNAHVVAGQDDTRIQPGGEGAETDADVVAFDPRNDVAVLRAPGAVLPALPVAGSVPDGAPGAVLGYPQNGPFDARAARLGRERTVLTQDAYGRGPVERRIVPLRGRVRPGNSGGPVVGEDGRVLATVFAATTGASGPEGGYAVPNAIVARALRRARAGGPVGTGPCTR